MLESDELEKKKLIAHEENTRKTLEAIEVVMDEIDL